MNVSLTPELEQYVRRKVASGLYNNASELIREALRLFVAREGAPIGRPTPEPLSKDEVLAKLAALVTQDGLDPAIRDRILREAEAVF
jgi:putative addiction module CopG family antidote